MQAFFLRLALAWPAVAAAAEVPQLPPPDAAPPLAAQHVSPAEAALLRFRITPALLKAALARDEGLGNALAQFVHRGVELSPADSGRQGRLAFVPQPAAALVAFIDDPSTPFPREPATQPGGASYRLESSPEGGHRLIVGVDDAQAADEAVVPKRWFEVTVAVNTDALTALAWRPLPIR